MPSSYFGQAGGHRKTPQTCYPPPPPQPPPGFCECTGSDPTQLIQLRLETEYQLVADPTAAVVRDVNWQMCNISFNAGQLTISATISGQQPNALTIKIYCVDDGISAPHWEGEASGIMTTPDGEEISDTAPRQIGPEELDHGDLAIYTIWTAINGPGRWENAKWRPVKMTATWYNVADTSRSRPPNPPIPALV